MTSQQDNNTENTQPTGKVNLFAVIAGVIMVTIYLGMAFLLVFTNLFIGKVPEWVRFLMGGVFFVYGIFRGYRVYSSVKNE